MPTRFRKQLYHTGKLLVLMSLSSMIDNAGYTFSYALATRRPNTGHLMAGHINYIAASQTFSIVPLSGILYSLIGFMHTNQTTMAESFMWRQGVKVCGILTLPSEILLFGSVLGFMAFKVNTTHTHATLGFDTYYAFGLPFAYAAIQAQQHLYFNEWVKHELFINTLGAVIFVTLTDAFLTQDLENDGANAVGKSLMCRDICLALMMTGSWWARKNKNIFTAKQNSSKEHAKKTIKAMLTNGDFMAVLLFFMVSNNYLINGDRISQLGQTAITANGICVSIYYLFHVAGLSAYFVAQQVLAEPLNRKRGDGGPAAVTEDNFKESRYNIISLYILVAAVFGGVFTSCAYIKPAYLSELLLPQSAENDPALAVINDALGARTLSVTLEMACMVSAAVLKENGYQQYFSFGMVIAIWGMYTLAAYFLAETLKETYYAYAIAMGAALACMAPFVVKTLSDKALSDIADPNTHIKAHRVFSCKPTDTHGANQALLGPPPA